MQATTSKLKTGFVKLGNNGLWLAVSDDMIKELSINEDVLLKLEFSITVTNSELILRAPLPKDKALSNHAPEFTGGTQE